MRKKKANVEELEVLEETPVKEYIEAKEVPKFYVLKIGETLTDVAKKFGVDEAKLKELNGEVVGTNQIRVK